MINRMRGFYEGPEEQQPREDYHVVSSNCEYFFVTRAVAEGIVLELDVATPPKWIRFTNLHGSHITLRSEQIEYVQEWTAVQRRAARAFRRARDREKKADERSWEDED